LPCCSIPMWHSWSAPSRGQRPTVHSPLTKRCFQFLMYYSEKNVLRGNGWWVIPMKLEGWERREREGGDWIFSVLYLNSSKWLRVMAIPCKKNALCRVHIYSYT
jgi:hypothetical protein